MNENIYAIVVQVIRQAQAKAVLDQARALYADSELSDEECLTFLQDIQRLFLEFKKEGHDKFTLKTRKKQTPPVLKG